ncbi:hypothetical protein Aperf_G00000058426 [Anoplocephala perfoliata]
MKLFRGIFFSLSFYIAILIFLWVGDSAFCNGQINIPTWRERSRHIFIKRWSHGLRYVHLSPQDQWPLVLNPFPTADATPKIELKLQSEQPVPSTHQSTPSPREEVLLPPMDESVVNELSQPNMPTFQEFHAKVLGENQNKRRLDEPISGIPGATNSNLSKPPNRGDEDSPHASVTSTTISSSVDANSIVTSENGGTTSGGDSLDVIHPSSVSENGGGNGGGKCSGSGCGGQELRVMRNIAASECGAKLLQASPAAKHPHSILVDNNDEYMNQPCASEKWFIIETCEPVQLGTIQMANYELFSSRCKTFRVYGSDRYPAKQWEQIGTFQAQDVKGLQTFHIKDAAEGRLIKYVKFEILDHYGNEHFCPITMVRLFGLSSDDLDDSEPSVQQAAQAPAASMIDVHQSPGVDETNSESVEYKLNGGSNTSLLNASRSEAPEETRPLNASIRKKPKLRPVDPPVNLSSTTNKAENENCSEEQVLGSRAQLTPASQRSTGLWQHATRFVMNIIQRAIGGKSSSAHSQTLVASPTGLTSGSADTADPTSDDFYSVIYIFSSQPTTLPPITEPRSRGLWHLARCLLALQDSTPTREVLVSSLHRAWADCYYAAYFLDLPLSSKGILPRLAKLASAYRNLTAVFGRWSDDTGLTMMRSEKFKGGLLPLPEFLKKREAPSLRDDSGLGGSKGSEQADGQQRESVVLAETPPQDSPSEAQFVPSSTPPSTTQQTQDDGKDSSPRPPPVQVTNEPEKQNNLAQESSDVQLTSEFHDQEVVLPAAMGGSWKETMYMRLNNKVLQLQSDVSVSMRYLEELSQSYKRQTERLSASFNITTAWLKATAKGAEERDLLQQERIDALEVQLAKLLHILAEQGLVIVQNPSTINRSSSGTHSSVPNFQRPFPSSSSSGVNLQSILWSVFFQSPALQSTSRQKNSKRPFFGASTSSLSATTSIIDNEHAEGLAFNTTTVLPLAKTTAKSSSAMVSKTGRNLKISSQASLLLHGGIQNRHRAETETKRMKRISFLDDGGWRFMLVVAARHLRNFILSETFQLWLLHIFFAVMAQTFVYVIFLRKALQRCIASSSSSLPPTPSSSSSPICCGRCPCTNSADTNACTNGGDTIQYNSSAVLTSESLNLHFTGPCKEEEKISVSFPSFFPIKEEPKNFEHFASNGTAVVGDDPICLVRRRKFSPKLEEISKMEERISEQTDSPSSLINGKDTIHLSPPTNTPVQSVATQRIGDKSFPKRRKQKQRKR